MEIFYNITNALVIHNLESIVKEYTKRWPRLLKSANTRHLYLPVKKMMMKFTLPSDACSSSQPAITTRNILRLSKNPEIHNLYEDAAPKNIEANTLFHQDKPKNKKNRLINKTVNKILDDMKGLKEENIIIDSISQQCSCTSINQWQRVCEGLRQSIFISVRKVIILQLANNTNFFRWKRVLSSDCGLCNTNKHKQLHILNNCPEAVRNGRYTWRHDSILFTICHYLTALGNIGFEFLADLTGFKNPLNFV